MWIEPGKGSLGRYGWRMRAPADTALPPSARALPLSEKTTETDDEPLEPRARYFTPEEANGLLPEVLVHVYELNQALERARQSEGDNESLGDLEAHIRRIVARIQELGLDVKGLSPVLLDFPALLNGRDVCLCWKEGESCVEWWHSTQTGFSGRQRLGESERGSWEWNN